jgi:hypothetical protein
MAKIKNKARTEKAKAWAQARAKRAKAMARAAKAQAKAQAKAAATKTKTRVRLPTPKAKPAKTKPRGNPEFRREEVRRFARIKRPKRPKALTDQELGRHAAIETAERNRKLETAARCGGCGGFVYQWPCILCELRANEADDARRTD